MSEKDLLLQLLANQVVIYKKLDEIQKSAKGVTNVGKSLEQYKMELEKEAKQITI